LWFFGALGLIAVVLSLGTESHYWVPWRVLAHIPVVQNIIPGRFMVIVTLCAAAVLAIVVDRTHDVVAGWLRQSDTARHGAARRRTAAPWVAGAVALVVAAVAIVPTGSAIASNIPLTTRPVVLPLWFTVVAPKLPPHQVVLTVPAPFSLVQSAMAWQAADLLRFAMVGGSGPGGLPVRAGPERAGLEVVSSASISLNGPPVPRPGTVRALRQALAGWGVTLVVIPDPALLPRYDRGTNPAAALGLFTVALGRRPQYRDGAWVWSGVQVPVPRLSISTGAFDRCTSEQVWRSGSRQAVPDCVTAASRSAG
jgi:hypothetical protein